MMGLKMETLAITVAIMIGFAAAMRSSMPDLILDKEESGNDVQSNNIPGMLGGQMDPLRETPCQMEIRYTKQITGKCTKLGQGVDGCVAGSYIHPFHHECLFAR